jgi:Mg2+/Co2+ transporter CorC
MSDADEVDTLGGLIITLAGHVPARGEIVSGDGIEFEVRLSALAKTQDAHQFAQTFYDVCIGQ